MGCQATLINVHPVWSSGPVSIFASSIDPAQPSCFRKPALATMILLTLASASLCAVLAPAASSARISLFQRLFGRRATRESVAFAPPRITSDEGWTFIQCEDAKSFLDWIGRDQEGLPFRDGEPMSLGSHVLIEMYDCDQDSLKLEDTVGDAMRDAAVNSKATVVAESFHEFKPWGVSGAVIIQESHYTIHTWPEHGYAAVDLFYCGGTVHVHNAVDTLMDRFKPGRIKFLVVRRGRENEVAG